MKKIKCYISAMLFMMFLTVFSSVPLSGTTAVAEAAAIRISHSEIKIPVNTTKLISVTGTSKRVTWTSSNTSVATISSIGYVTAKSEGTATITASVNGKKLKCKVVSYIPMSISSKSFTLNAKKSSSLELIGAVKQPSWSSSNTKVAKVSKYGTVTGVSKGSATITAAVGTRKFTSKVTVLEPITINAKTITLTEGQTYNLKVNGITYRAAWSTSSRSIAAVSINGTVTALKAGKVTITAFVDGEKLTCTATVKKASGISEYSFALKAGEKSAPLTPPVVTVTPTVTPAATPSVTPAITPEVTPIVTETPAAGDSEATPAITEISSPTSPVTENQITATAPTITEAPSALQWKSSNTQVAAVSAEGIVKGIKQGTAIITATYGNQKFTYQAIILSQYNAYLSKAPFSAREATFDRITYLLPSNWDTEIDRYPDSVAAFAYNDNDGSNIIIAIQKNNAYSPNYFTARKELKDISSLSTINFQYENMLVHTGIKHRIKNYKQSDYQSDIGNVLKTQFTVTLSGKSFTQTVYDLYLEKYLIEIVVTDASKGSAVQKIGEYILNSITLGN